MGAGILVAWDALADGTGPKTDSVEALAHIHHHSHDFIVSVAFEGLANRSQLCVQPELIDGDRALFLELV